MPAAVHKGNEAMDKRKGTQKPHEKSEEAAGPGEALRDDDVEVIDSSDDGGEAIEVEPAERIGALDREVEELAGQNAVLLDSLKRLKADFDNYRKRMLKEQSRILETAESELITKLLPVIDNLERALESAGDETSGLRDGVAMVLEMMLGLLERDGLEVIDPEGEPFDPEHHEAMMVVETDECPEGTVVDVVQKGYRFSGALLRPAMVRVSCPVPG